MLLHMEAFAENGRWSGVLILSVVNEQMVSRQVLDGEFFESHCKIHIDEASEGFPVSERNVNTDWGRALFRHYKIPEVSLNEVAHACSVIRSGT